MDNWSLVDFLDTAQDAVLDLLPAFDPDAAQEGPGHFAESVSTRFNQEPCFGVCMYTKRFGRVAR